MNPVLVSYMYLNPDLYLSYLNPFGSKHLTLAFTVPHLKVFLKKVFFWFCFSNLDTSELCGMYITLYDLHVTFFFLNFM